MLASECLAVDHQPCRVRIARLCAYRVHREYGNDFVPFRTLVGLEVELLCEAPCEPVYALFHVQARVRLARQPAREGVLRVTERVSAISLVQHKIANGNRVGRVIGQLRHPRRGSEHHLERDLCSC
jgi:hypothetical protein